jgi:hypothetical protein
MSEVCTPPYKSTDKHGDDLFTFGPDHTLADIARWIMEHRGDAEDIHSMLGQMLNGTFQ